jgi:malate/lactate dehydrogenase
VVIPIDSFQKNFGVTLSLPSVVGRGGAVEVLQPEMSDEERSSLQNSAEALTKALERVRKAKSTARHEWPRYDRTVGRAAQGRLEPPQ